MLDLSPSLGDRRRRRIGLLGGSFNPAHRGHRHISLLALKLLALDEIWWLVSPQNPLKPALGMAPFAARLAAARCVANHPRIKITDLEARLGSRFTAHTLAALRRRFPQTRFVWMMGADNLRQIPHWESWQLAGMTPPAWVFFATQLDPLSATAIRERRRRTVFARKTVPPGRPTKF